MRLVNCIAEVLKKGFQKCCGKLTRAHVRAPLPVRSSGILLIDKSGDASTPNQVDKIIFDLIVRGNLPQAEILVRENLERDLGSAKLFNYLGWIAAEVNLPKFSLQYFSKAVEREPQWDLPRNNLNRVQDYLRNRENQALFLESTFPKDEKTEKFLLIKAWGCGFLSDVSHVLSQLLLAEVTGRIPMVHWGSNSLFWDGVSENAFDAFFKPVSNWSISDIQKKEFSFWPPKWGHRNLTNGAVNQWSGSFSRMAGIYLLGRHENVVVSDFFTSVFDLKPWIPRESDLYGLTVDELWMYLVKKYLRPQDEIIELVSSFYEANLASEDFVAVHARGSDKVLEMENLERVNLEYKDAIDKLLATHGCKRVFLMTDDSRLQDYFVSIYGDNLISTECQRTNNIQGIHYQEDRDRRQLGIEVMVDVYLAIKAKAFVGNGLSNPSLIIRYMKAWPQESVELIGQNMFNSRNTFLHNW